MFSKGKKQFPNRKINFRFGNIPLIIFTEMAD